LSKYLLITASILLALTYWRVGAFLGAGLVDDAYIFARYAQNVAQGQGLVFNPGERVEGYSSPLWVLYLGGLARLGVDPAQGAAVSSALLGLAAVFAVLYAGTRYAPGSPLLSTVPAWFLVTNPSFIFWAWSGMDTALFTCLFLASVALFWAEAGAPRGTMFLSGAAFVAAAFSRLEIVSVLPVYLSYLFWANRRQRGLLPAKAASFLAPALLLVVHWIWRYRYYGALLPNTFAAKVGVPRSVLLAHGLGYGASFALAYAPWLIGGVVSWALLRRSQRERAAGWLYALAAIAAWSACVVGVGGDHFALFRFFVPVLPLLAFLAMPLLALPGRWMGSKGSLALVPVVVLVLALNGSVFAFHGGGRALMEVEMARRWAEVGRWLGQNVPPGARIASLVVGAIPYYSHLATYDLLGLTDREVAVEGQTYLDGQIGHQKYNTDYILRERPEYIVYPSSGLRDTPQYRGPEAVDREYAYAFYDLLSDERTAALYEYRSARMASGRYVEWFQLRKEGP
jgi:arabinofuranosyltransferase